MPGASVIAPPAFICSNLVIYWTGFKTNSFLFSLVAIGFALYAVYYHVVMRKPAARFGRKNISWLLPLVRRHLAVVVAWRHWRRPRCDRFWLGHSAGVAAEPDRDGSRHALCAGSKRNRGHDGTDGPDEPGGDRAAGAGRGYARCLPAIIGSSTDRRIPERRLGADAEPSTLARRTSYGHVLPR